MNYRNVVKPRVFVSYEDKKSAFSICLADLVTFMMKNQRRSFCTSLQRIDGIGPKTVDYMKCLVGIDSIAVDRHTLTFLPQLQICFQYQDVAELVYGFFSTTTSFLNASFTVGMGHWAYVHGL